MYNHPFFSGIKCFASQFGASYLSGDHCMYSISLCVSHAGWTTLFKWPHTTGFTLSGKILPIGLFKTFDIWWNCHIPV